MAGAKAVASAFSEYPVTLLRVSLYLTTKVFNMKSSGKERCTFEKFCFNSRYGYNGNWWIRYRQRSSSRKNIIYFKIYIIFIFSKWKKIVNINHIK
jgi:hypothetical protein